jgi:hypothetical protein
MERSKFHNWKQSNETVKSLVISPVRLANRGLPMYLHIDNLPIDNKRTTCIVADGPQVRFASRPIRVLHPTGKPDWRTGIITDGPQLRFASRPIRVLHPTGKPDWRTGYRLHRPYA